MVFERKMYLQRLLNDEGLRQVIQVLASSIGSGTNVQRIANTFNSKEHVAIKPMTIQKYLGHLEDAFIIQQALRYNIKGRKYIGTETKYYFEDLGVKNAILNFRQSDEYHPSHYNEMGVYIMGLFDFLLNPDSLNV